MAISRYSADMRIDAGTMLGTSLTVNTLRQSIKSGAIVPLRTIRTSGFERLDTLAGEIYGDSRYWWILAAGSDIGWGLQVPPGTVINVISMEDVNGVVS